MTTYARQQCTAAQLLITAHRPDLTGCCATCGRPAPCVIRREAEQAHQRYATWLASEPVRDDGHRLTPPGRRVRPYVTYLGPG
jgi:hypothetical protein